MKKLIALILIGAVLATLVGCQKNASETTEPPPDVTNKISGVMKAWSGEFSKEKLTSVINTYRRNYANVFLEKDGASSFSFETEFDVASCLVSCISPTDNADIDVELHGYIDLFLDTRYEGKTVTIPLDWWYRDSGSWIHEYLVWSYLVRLEDANGNRHYYYFRVDYSAYAP